MVGIVIVSHSAALAAGVVELAREMGGEDIRIVAAGGMAEPEGAMGTDAELVRASIVDADSGDGVLVLMDLGSALMSAEMAAEMVAAEEGPRVLLCEAPLVEGAVAAAATARGGSTLEEVAAEARGALAMKAAQLGVQAPAGPDEPPAGPPLGGEDGGRELRLRVANRLGLHARPVARIIDVAGRFDARVTVTDETTGRGPADARSLTALLTLGARQGHEILVRSQGPDAGAVLDALRELAEAHFGDGDGDEAEAGAPRRPDGGRPAAPATATSASDDAPAPAPGTRLAGIPASAGVAVAPARPVGTRAAPAPPSETAADDPATEHAHLDAALAAARADIESARAVTAQRAGPEEAAIFDAHLLLLEDRALLAPVREAIEGQGRSAGAAWRSAAIAAAETYRALDDPYLRERAADVEDVAARVLRHLARAEGADLGADEMPGAEGIVLAANLVPSQAAMLDPAMVRGLAIAHGGATSHAAILARALGIPAVVGLGDTLLSIPAGTPLVLDGNAGTLDVDPGDERLAERERAAQAEAEQARSARRRAGEPGRLRDGEKIEVAANIGTPAEVPAALAQGADGVGLLRTEFLFLDRDTEPSEAEQEQAYREVAEALGGRPLVVRTLDAGADKPLRYLDRPPEENPFLGVRGLRLGLAQPELLAAQLRAILAVAADHPLSVMFPMVSTLAELRAARALLERERERLGVDPVPTGIMVEVPAVAVAARAFAAEADFLSIGTNDLAQYTMAAERGNAALASLLDGPLPAVLRLVAAVTEAARMHGRWVGVCGELAGEPAAAVVLAGLGVTELSMAAGRIPAVKDALRSVSRQEARELAERALELEDAAGVTALVAGRLGTPAATPGQ